MTSAAALPCMCANFRRATRTLTQRYDEALRPIGITVTQFTILQALSFTGEVTQGRLGDILAMDSTTLTRTLGIMIGHGWITDRRGTDRRERWVSLSGAGKSEFRRALPQWEKAQTELRTQLGDKRWKTLIHLVNQVTGPVTE